jgi:hypothetical protein
VICMSLPYSLHSIKMVGVYMIILTKHHSRNSAFNNGIFSLTVELGVMTPAYFVSRAATMSTL